VRAGSDSFRLRKWKISFHDWPYGVKIATTLALVVLVGVVDLFTGEELSFFVFYFIPVSFAAWTLGKSWSISTAFLCTCAWLGVEKFSGHAYSSPQLFIADLLIRWCSYTIMAGLFFTLKESRLQLHRYADELESRVAQRTTTLQERVAELETIAYSVSHNLRAPLRAIDGMADALADFAQEPPEAASCLGRIRASARRMDQLVVGLVDFVQVTLLAPEVRPVAIGPIIAEVVDEQCRKFPHEHVEITIAMEAPLVEAHNRLVYRVTTELVSNALRFVDGPRPHLDIKWELTPEDRVRVLIRDLGIGIDPQHQQRIFGLFEQLHCYEKFGGIGMGLATAKRCVEKMNGRIGVHSKGEGTGSQFWFELPKARRSQSA